MMSDATTETLTAWAEEARQDNLSEMEVLTEFVLHNAELEQLEERLRQFNIFEAVAMDWQEIKHSAFLAFLLDPHQPHGLGDDFLKKVLQRALLGKDTAALPVNVVQLHLMDLDETVVERERNRIDILLLNEEHKLAVILENKTLTGEHDDQLNRYYEGVCRLYPKWRVLGLYLTPDGADPSHSAYLPISYGSIADLIESLVSSRAAGLGPDILTLMRHYVQMLRRTIVSNPEIDDLCLRIYQKHRRAIDLIVSRIPNKQAIVHDELLKMVQSTPGIRLRWNSKQQMSFHPEEWDVPGLQYAEGKDAPSLIFQFRLYDAVYMPLKIVLEIGPATLSRRERLFNMTREYGKPFNSQRRTLAKKWNVVYTRTILSIPNMQKLEATEIIAEAYRQWSLLIDVDLPVIKQALLSQDWVWTTKTTDTLDSGGIDEQETDEEDDEQ